MPYNQMPGPQAFHDAYSNPAKSEHQANVRPVPPRPRRINFEQEQQHVYPQQQTVSRHQNIANSDQSAPLPKENQMLLNYSSKPQYQLPCSPNRNQDNQNSQLPNSPQPTPLHRQGVGREKVDYLPNYDERQHRDGGYFSPRPENYSESEVQRIQQGYLENRPKLPSKPQYRGKCVSLI